MGVRPYRSSPGAHLAPLQGAGRRPRAPPVQPGVVGHARHPLPCLQPIPLPRPAHPAQAITKEDFLLPTLGPKLVGIQQEVSHGRGFHLLRGLPVDRWSLETTTVVWWGIGLHWGKARSNNKAGHLVGHIKASRITSTHPSLCQHAPSELTRTLVYPQICFCHMFFCPRAFFRPSFAGHWAGPWKARDQALCHQVRAPACCSHAHLQKLHAFEG